MVRVGRRRRGEKFIWAKIRTEFRIPQFTDSTELGSPSCPTITPSKFLPPPKTGGAKPPDILKRGKLLTIDYGLTDDEMFSPARTNGTLRAYFRHHVSRRHSGKRRRTGFDRARQFFRHPKSWRRSRVENRNFFHADKISDADSGENFDGKNLWRMDSSRTRQFQTLTHPEHLGRAFRVLVQSR